MEYIAVKSFTDYVTGEHYAVGDRYPHRGFANKDRAEELSTNQNKRKEPMIKVKETPKAKAEPKAEPKDEPKEDKKTEEKKTKSQKK